MSDEIGSTTEEWKAIPGYEGLYSASNWGRIRSEPGRSRRPNAVLVLKPHIKRYGYLRVSLWKNGEVSYRDIHRLVILSFFGPHPFRPHVNHIDRNPSNNNLTNLEWCTVSENMRHSIRMIHGAFPKPQPPKPPRKWMSGESHYAHKLTDDEVRSIRQEYATGTVSQQRIADRFGMAQAHISQIILLKKWKHIA